MMMKRSRLLCLALLLGVVNPALAEDFISNQCEPLVETGAQRQDIPFDQGLLWRVSRNGAELGHIFGTIHISDTEVTTLPTPVEQALHSAEQFAMEALPEADQMLLLSQMMFFMDGRRLNDFVDPGIYTRTVEILADYKMGPDAVSVMKPWAAFLMMNYPPDTGEALDLVLLSIARDNNAELNGLESLAQQGEIFNQMALPQQVQLLVDSVCHYDVVKADFITMKELYLQRDLGGLHHHVNRYESMGEKVYQDLMQRLIVDRNHAMVERMQGIFDKGKSFIAIGALHLGGKDGVLSLLEAQGFEISSVF